MNAREKMAMKPITYAMEPCCDVPLSEEAPTCPWHGYRSLMVALSGYSLPEEVCTEVLRVETRAMVHALDFVRRTLVADAQAEAARGYAPMETLEKLVDRLNHLIEQIQR